jgi:cytochrome c oxidase subunit 2
MSAIPGQPLARLCGISVALLLGALAGCEGQQSALDPAGRGAQSIAALFWWLAGGALVIWLIVMGIAFYATRMQPREHSIRSARWLIIGGGVIFPVVVLTGLLIYGLTLMPQLSSAENVSLRIDVSGEQWWWRVRYRSEAGEQIELANEIRLPVGERVAFSLTSPDVIHSFWIPSLGGKVDMIPGRTNQLVLEPTRTGTFRGACAEYCGACHQVRGTEADGTVGPDLTHVGSRLSLAAGTLPADVDAFARWIGHTGAIKPDVRMPAFGMLPEAELNAMAHYLKGLE